MITSENSEGIAFRKDFMGITSKYSRGINYVILAFRMVHLPSAYDILLCDVSGTGVTRTMPKDPLRRCLWATWVPLL